MRGVVVAMVVVYELFKIMRALCCYCSQRSIKIEVDVLRNVKCIIMHAIRNNEKKERKKQRVAPR